MKPAKATRHTRLPRGPFFHPFDVRSLKGEARSLDLAATADECAAVAQAIHLPAIDALNANLRLRPRAGGRVEVDGRVTATVTQLCVVTLEPFESVLEQPVSVMFAPDVEPVAEPRSRGNRGAPAVPVSIAAPAGGNDDQEDPPDVMIDDTIDLGSLAVEFLALALDPYPRKPGVHFDDMVVGEKDAPAPSAFAALAGLKDRS